MLPFGLSTVVIAIWLRTSSSDSPLATSLAGSTWTRIDGFCWPPMMTCATPEIWLICWASWASTASLTVVRGSGQQEDRRVRRVDLAIGRRRGKGLRQLPARGIDGALNVVGSAVDIAV